MPAPLDEDLSINDCPLDPLGQLPKTRAVAGKVMHLLNLLEAYTIRIEDHDVCRESRLK